MNIQGPSSLDIQAPPISTCISEIHRHVLGSELRPRHFTPHLIPTTHQHFFQQSYLSSADLTKPYTHNQSLKYHSTTTFQKDIPTSIHIHRSEHDSFRFASLRQKSQPRPACRGIPLPFPPPSTSQSPTAGTAVIKSHK